MKAASHLIPSLSTLLIGDSGRPEFCAVTELLIRQPAVRRVSRLETALAECQAAGEFPDLVVLAQSRPGEFNLAALDQLRRGAPLARVITVLGSWCAGETRSGAPLAGVMRLYWHEAPAYLAREFERQQIGKCPDWGLPVTATLVDRSSAIGFPLNGRIERQITIHSSNHDLADWLARACCHCGYTATRYQPGLTPALENTAAVIWDAWRLDAAELAELQGWSSVPLLVLLDYPHWANCQRALEAGAHVVLAKPVRLQDLCWHLDQLWESASSSLPK